MVLVSDSVMDALGFRPLHDGELISASFHELHVYEIRGFTVEEEAFPPFEGAVASRPFKVAVGSSVNAVCRQLAGDALVDDEQAWQREHNCTPPYLVVQIGPTQPYEFAGRFVRSDAPEIHTYAGFSEARVDLHQWAACVLPCLLSGLTCSFSALDHPVKFLPRDRTIYGVASDGRTLLDTRFTVSAHGYGSSRLGAFELQKRIAEGIALSQRIKPKVASLLHLGLMEDDLLKRFLWLFLAIEVQTHASFAAIDHDQGISELIAPPARVSSAAMAFFREQEPKSLKDRFVWCVLFAWRNLGDRDVEVFKELKRCRDKIAHGEISVPPADLVAKAQDLAQRLHAPATGSDAISQ